MPSQRCMKASISWRFRRQQERASLNPHNCRSKYSYHLLHRGKSLGFREAKLFTQDYTAKKSHILVTRWGYMHFLQYCFSVRKLKTQGFRSPKLHPIWYFYQRTLSLNSQSRIYEQSWALAEVMLTLGVKMPICVFTGFKFCAREEMGGWALGFDFLIKLYTCNCSKGHYFFNIILLNIIISLENSSRKQRGTNRNHHQNFTEVR